MLRNRRDSSRVLVVDDGIDRDQVANEQFNRSLGVGEHQTAGCLGRHRPGDPAVGTPLAASRGMGEVVRKDSSAGLAAHAEVGPPEEAVS